VKLRCALLSVGQGGANADRAEVIRKADQVVVLVADGAGGTPRGAEAAETVLTRGRAWAAGGALTDAVGLLAACDRAICSGGSGGETTAVIAVLDASGVTGASVGDSGAWMVSPTWEVDLTGSQVRKPLVGSGGVVPVAFTHGAGGTLVVATDGLFKYASAVEIRRIACGEPLDDVPARLVDSVRLRSGRLQDDTTVVVCRYDFT
jgi:PPM family protein phosphatase